LNPTSLLPGCHALLLLLGEAAELMLRVVPVLALLLPPGLCMCVSCAGGYPVLC
jgi:hypothetical protein